MAKKTDSPPNSSENSSPKESGSKKIVSSDGQKECCIIGCCNSASKRSRFSLRLYKDKDFKQDFIENNWNKVCERHYFQDLYQFKKLNKTNTVRNSKASNANTNSSTAESNAKEVETEAIENTRDNGSMGSAQEIPAAQPAKKERRSATKKRDYETMNVVAEEEESTTPTDSVAPVAKKRKIWTLKEKTMLIHKIATKDEETVKRIIDVITSSCPGSCNFFHNEDTLEVDVNKFDESTFEKIQVVVGFN